MRELGEGLAQINKISTVVDGSIRVTLDINPSESKLIENLFKKKIAGDSGVVVVAFVDVGDEYDGW